MPVDLSQQHDEAMDDMPPLTAQDDMHTHRANFSHAQQLLAHIMGEDAEGYDRSDLRNEMPEALQALHPYGVTLGVCDLESCLKIEGATFPPELAGSREQFTYRLTKASELCFGIFTSADPASVDHKAATAATAYPTDSSNPTRKGVLLGHIIATKCDTEFVQDGDMAVGGHNEAGRTIALHSLAVLPEYQKRGIASILMKAYVQRMSESRTADRISILTYERLVPFYEGLGFVDKGKGGSQHGGENWVNMILDFADIEDDDEDEDEDDEDEDDEDKNAEEDE